MNSQTKQAFAYTRMARMDAGDLSGHQNTHAIQLQRIKNFATIYGYEISMQCSDVGVNKEFSWLYEQLSAHPEIKYILVSATDRLTRSYYDYKDLEQKLYECYGVKIVVVPNNVYLIDISLN